MQVKVEVRRVVTADIDGSPDQTTVQELQARLQLAVDAGWTIIHAVALGESRVLFIATKP